MSETTFRQHDAVVVVECDPDTCLPVEGGKTVPATVESQSRSYVQARLVSGALWTFHQGSGLAATPELSRWRLVPVAAEA